MNIGIKGFDVDMEIKNKGVELEIRNPDGTHRGDLIITKTKLIWCKGRTRRKNGISASWDHFMKYMEGD